MAFLGIDAGATATKWSLYDDNNEVGAGLLPAMDAHLYRESSLERFHQNFNELKLATEKFKIEGITLGITGLSDISIIKHEISRFFQCEITVMSDIELAYRANFNDSQGILLYAGTGSVSLTINTFGEFIKVGGWGYLLGDEGAGYWIGREAIRSALFAIERGKPIQKDSLNQTILNNIGANDWDGVKQFVYGKERFEVAQLARIVLQMCELGDSTAREISDNAGAHLSDLVARTDLAIGNKNSMIVFTGGVSKSKYISEYLIKEFEGRLKIGDVDIAKAAAKLTQPK